MQVNISQALKRLHLIVATKNDSSVVTAAKTLLEHSDRSLARFWQAVSAVGICAIAVMLLALLTACNFKSPAGPRQDLHRNPLEQNAASVRIEIACVTGDAFTGSLSLSGAYGSGVVISNGTVLTAHHVVRCAGVSIINVIDADGRKWPANVEHSDSSRDFARLHVPGMLTNKPAHIVPPKVGDWVCLATAFPVRGSSCGSVLTVHEFDTPDNGTVDFEFDAVIVSGNSGSGIYNSAGDLVGLGTNSRGCLIAGECGGLGSSLAGRFE